MNGTNINIFEYNSFRDILRDYYDHRKKAQPNFSYRSFGKRAGFTSSSFMPNVISGKRSLTKDYIPRFASAMGMNKKEEKYFEALVSFNQAKTPEARRYYLEILHSIKKEKVGTLLKDEQFEYISNWHYAVIRELIALPNFKEDPQWIRKRLDKKITAGQAKEAIEKLLKLGLATRDEKGRLKQTASEIITEDEVINTAVYTYHQQMLSLAKEVLAKTQGNGTEVTGITLPVSKKQFSEIKRMIRDFQKDIIRFMASNPDIPETVSQINIQFFPLIEKEKGEQDA